MLKKYIYLCLIFNKIQDYKKIHDTEIKLTIDNKSPKIVGVNETALKIKTLENNKKLGTEIKLIGDIPDKIFKKTGTFFKEESKRKNERKQTIHRELTFRQKIESKDGKEKKKDNASSALDGSNLENFEKMGIPIDPKKDKRKKPDDFNNWKWDTKEENWKLVGEPKIKLSNGTIITEKEWQKMLMYHTKQI